MLHTIRQNIIRKRHALASLSYLSLNNVVASLIGFFSVLILANALSTNEYGNYKYVFSVVGLLGTLSLTGGFRTMVIQSVSRGHDGVVKHLAKSNLRLSIPMLVATLALSAYYHTTGNDFLAITLPIVAVASIFTNNATIVFSYLNGRKDFSGLLRYQSITSLVSLCVLVGIVSLSRNLIVIIFGTSVALVLSSLLSLYLVQKRHVRNETLDTQVLKYGKHINFLNVLSTILQNIDSILIFHFLGSESLALYAMATPFVDRILAFFKASYFFALPKFTEQGPTQARRLLFQRSAYAFLIGIGVVGVYALVAPIIFHVFFPKYIASIPLSLLFALNIPLVALNMLPSAYIDSLIEIKNKYILYAGNFVIRISSLFIFLHLFGVAGVIYSELVTRIAILGITIVLIEKYQKKVHTN